MSSKVIYTVIFGNYDSVKSCSYINKDYDYLLFTDKETALKQSAEIKRSNWSVIIIKNDYQCNLMQSKDIKINPHNFLSDYKESVYIDGSMSQVGDIRLITESNRFSFSVCKHPRRDCVYEEALVCINQKRGNHLSISNQVKEYKNVSFPENNGLYMGGILHRVHNAKNKKISNLWWSEINRHSTRDQLSLPFILWKLNETVGVLDYENEIKNTIKIKNHL